MFFLCYSNTSTRSSLKNYLSVTPVHPHPKTRNAASTRAKYLLGLITHGNASFSASPRFSAAVEELKNLPPFSQSDPDYVPSRSSFLRTKATQCFTYLLILDLTSLGARSPADPKNFSPDQVPFLTRLNTVSVEEIALRIITSAASGVVIYSLFQAIYCFVAFATVALGLSDCVSWHPLFNSPLDAWSIRQLWGYVPHHLFSVFSTANRHHSHRTFCHQGTRSKLSNPSQYITYKILRFQRGSFVGRYLAIILKFAMSGLMHLCGEIAVGLHWHDSGALQFFCTQALGLMIEDQAQLFYRYLKNDRQEGEQAQQQSKKRSDPAHRVGGKWHEGSSTKINQRPPLRNRLIGYVWVVVWMVWSMPVWTYPTSRLNGGEAVLPFGVLRHLV